MGCSGGMSSIQYTRSGFTLAFRANFSFSFPRKKIVIGKKDRCAVFGCNNDRLFPEKYTAKFSLCPKARVNTERVPSGHPIILLKSSKFNMAAVSVKRTILLQIAVLFKALHGSTGPV